MNDSIIKAILIDDSESYGFELKGLAAEHNIEIIHYNNLQNAIEENPALENINFIILDAHCIIEEESSTPDFDFLPSALLDIESIQNKTGKKIPICINTGFSEQQKLNRYRNKFKIFDKTSDENSLFAYITEVVNKDDEIQFKFENSEIFKLFENNILSFEHKKELIEVYKAIRNNGLIEIKSILRRMRPIIESSLKKLKETDKHLIPDGYFNTGVPNVSGIIYHLGGKQKFNKERKEMEYHAEKILPDHIYVSLNTLYDITSKVAMHDYEEEVTKNSLKSCYYSLLEYLNWFSKFYSKNYI